MSNDLEKQIGQLSMSLLDNISDRIEARDEDPDQFEIEASYLVIFVKNKNKENHDSGFVFTACEPDELIVRLGAVKAAELFESSIGFS